MLPTSRRDPISHSRAVQVGGSPSTGGTELQPGEVLADRYRIVALLGRGGMGEVYRADDLRLGQPVALKFLPRTLDADPTRLDRFLNEVRTARQVSHPNVCRVYDVGEVAGRHFLSMEYIDGEDLSSLLRRIGRLPTDKALEIARQLCAARAAAHDKGVLHRDLKPANVMLDGRGKVRLTDFGLAEAEGTGTRAEFAGTPAYMAPEQFSGQPASVQTDVYALGLVLYEVFSGKRAFEAPSMAELRRLHEESHAAQLTTSVRDLDPTIERVIFRCLEKDPRNRPASAIAVAAALPGGDPLAAALAAGETPSPEMVAAAGERGGLRPVLAVAALVFVIVGVVAAAITANYNSALARLPLNDSPDVLAFKAREMLTRLGHQPQVADEAHGLRWDTAYQEWVERNDRSARRWQNLGTGHTFLQYWRRTSPSPLAPQRFMGGRLIEGGNVRPNDPPHTLVGMTTVQLDSRGRLLRLDVVPTQDEPPDATPAPAPDWPRVLVETGVDVARAVSVPPRWTPPVFADARAAWTATYPDLPAMPFRVEAAAYRGRPVYVQVVPEWGRPDREPGPQDVVGAAGTAVSLFVLVAIVVGSVAFARRNLLLGRSDERGAGRLALAVGSIVLGSLLLQGHHIAGFLELVVVLRAVCWALFGGAFVWVLYLALEPPIRRRWPHTLIGWSRLLTGRVTDPLVGRDALVGAVIGVLVGHVGALQRVMEAWYSQAPPAPDTPLLGPLLGVRLGSSTVLLMVYDAAFTALAVFFLVFLLRLVLRRDALAAAAYVLVAVVQNVLTSSNVVVAGILSAIVVGAMMVALFRFGLLSFGVAVLFASVLAGWPLTSNLSAWYGTATVLAVLVLGTLAFAAFRVALAGRPLLGANVD